MFGRRLAPLVLATLAALPAVLPAAEYRGMTAGWPVYANGYYAANYQANYGAAPAYYVARPVVAAGYAARPSATMYVPVRAAYANPSYFAAYGSSPVAYRPVTTAGYAPAAGYVAPVTTNYAPANSYAVTPAGLSSAGSEAAPYFGQPAALNYVPPRFSYRTTYSPVPVYMYRPVTTYDPITAQPVTCLQATTSTCCQPQRTRSWFSWLHPSNWFNHSSCRPACGTAPTTAYCGTATSQCGQPYYPVQPVVPVTPLTPSVTLPPNIIPATPSTAIPSTIYPSTVSPATPRVPPPPTGAAVPGARVIGTPADSPPRLGPGVTPLPSTTLPQSGIPGGSFTPLPSTTIPSTPVPNTTVPGTTVPGTTVPPAGSFPTGPGAFGTGTNYAPAVDPYNSPALTPATGVPSKGQPTGPSHSVFGSGYRSAEPGRDASGGQHDNQVIRAPELRPAMPPSVQTVPDLDRSSPPRPTSNAPQLLKPRDKTAASADHRWAVVPAVWPVKTATPEQQQLRPEVSTVSRNHQSGPVAMPFAHEYDERGWKSASF